MTPRSRRESASTTLRAGPGSSVRAIGFVWLGLALATFVGLLLLGRHMTFWQDEWAFVGFEPSSLGAYLVPHNEHW